MAHDHLLCGGDPWATYDAWLEGPYTDAEEEVCEECGSEECGGCDGDDD